MGCITARQLFPCPAGICRNEGDIMHTVLEIFRELSAIPRPTYHEERVADYLESYGRRIGCSVYRDKKNNVVLERNPKNASPADCLILQAHMDMVCRGDPGYRYNSEQDSILCVEENGWLRANHTTLGADNGIGVAVILKLMEESEAGYPLRAIFTTEEEKGMGGAKALSPKYLIGRYFIGLDWVSSRSTCISCAGSVIVVAKKYPKLVQPQGMIGVEIQFGGLSGGHSGTEIHRSGNAVQVCANLLSDLALKGICFEIATIEGGTAANVIPETCTCVLTLQVEPYGKLLQELENPTLCASLNLPEGESVSMSYREIPKPELVWSQEDISATLNFLCSVPNGSLISKGAGKEFAVLQSSNIGKISLGEELEVTLMARANSEELLSAVYEDIRNVGQLDSMEITLLSRDPVYRSNTRGELLNQVCDIYRRQNGVELKREIIHAGMECGYFQQKNSELEIVVLGAELRDIHTTRERMELGSEETVYHLLRELLRRIDIGGGK